VLTRVLLTALTLALAAGVLLSSSAASAVGRRPDALADAAKVALATLGQRQQVHSAVAQQALLPDDPSVVAADASFAGARAAVAALAAPRAGVDPAALDAAWGQTTEPRLIAMLAALSQVGVPYRGYKASPEAGFDCSGLTMWAWAQAGVHLAHQSGTQLSNATPRSLASLQPGDLVQYPGHVMMSLGFGSAIVHAPHSGKTVEVKAWSKARRGGSPIG
jgi:cell wall-associated NlpC family hydrolase